MPVIVRSALSATSKSKRMVKRQAYGESMRGLGLGSVSGCLSIRTLSFHVIHAR